MIPQHTVTVVPSPTLVPEVVKDKRYQTKQQREYMRYLQSPRWRTLARAVRMRAKGKCEICLRADGEECAHLTYDRIFNELMTDLLWLCKNCHRELDERIRLPVAVELTLQQKKIATNNPHIPKGRFK